MVPAGHVRILLDAELPGARAWAERRDFRLELIPDLLEVRVTMSQVATSELFYLRGRFDGYRAIPPAWSYTNSDWDSTGEPRHFPRIQQPLFGSPMYIQGGRTGSGGPGVVICAPFNRLAYVQEQGPHADWSLAGWTSAGAGHVQAHTLGDMLQAIGRDFACTRGRMG